MFKDVDDFYSKASESVRIFDGFIRQYGLKGEVIADHICYKVSSSDIFEDIRKMFEKESKFVYQANISGRRICTTRTKQKLTTLAGEIDVVELSDQKPDGSQTDGFDHIEIYPTTISYDFLVSKLKDRGLNVNEIVRPHHTTHDIKLENGFIIRLTRDRLVEKVTREMMS